MLLLTDCTFCVVLILRELQILQITEFIVKYRRNWREHVERIPEKKHLKISTKSRKFGKTTGVMEEFCFIICITDLNRQTIRKSNNDVMFPNEGNILLLTSYSSIIIFSSFFSVLTSTSVH